MRYLKCKYQLVDNYEALLKIPINRLDEGTCDDGRVELVKCNPDFCLLRIKKGFTWDGPSGPTVDTDDFMIPALEHDALYMLMRQGVLPRRHRKKVDELLKERCIAQGMNELRAAYVYFFVRKFGKGATLEKNERKVYQIIYKGK
jgi:hypothetical protein